MNAHRAIIKPNGRVLSIELPKEFLANNDVEVIILPFVQQKTKQNKVNLKHLRGALSHLSEEKKNEADIFFTNIRNEWE